MTKVLKIDLATKMLDANVKVHLVRPGARYALRDIILENKALPADAPLLDIPDGLPIDAAEDLLPQMERARVLRAWLKSPLKEDQVRPALDVDFYRTGLEDNKTAGARTNILRNANEILWKLPENTLVVIPASSMYGNAILAEMASPTEDRLMVQGRGRARELLYPARRIYGLKLVSMRELPEAVTDIARTTRVVEEISDHPEDRILRMYYGDYQRQGEFVAGLKANTQTFDARVIGQLVGLHMAIESTLKDQNKVTPGEALFMMGADAPQFHARVDSPFGRAFLESTKVVTFAVKLLMVVALSSVSIPEAAQAIEAGCLVVENSGDAGDHQAVAASQAALVDFARISGHNDLCSYLEALQEGLNRVSAHPSGDASLE